MADTETSPWKYRLSTLGLLLSYLPSYAIPRYVFERDLGSAIAMRPGWPFNAYVVTSYALVTAGLFLAVLGPRVVKPGPLRVVWIFLLVNWLPHNLALLIGVPFSSGSWID